MLLFCHFGNSVLGPHKQIKTHYANKVVKYGDKACNFMRIKSNTKRVVILRKSSLNIMIIMLSYFENNVVI